MIPRLTIQRTPALVYALLGIGLLIVFIVASGLFDALIYSFVNFSAIIAILFGIRRNRFEHPRPWYLLAIGLAATAAGDAIWTIYEFAIRSEAPFPSLADVLYLIGYPFLALALVSYCAAAKPSRSDLIDVAIIGTGYGLLTWAFFLDEFLEDRSTPLLQRLVSAAYPAADIPLVAAAALLLLTIGLRHRAVAIFTVAVVIGVGADIAYTRAISTGSYTNGGLIDIGWMLASLAWGLSALSPAERVAPPPVRSIRLVMSGYRLAFLALAALAGPATWFIEAEQDDPLDLPIIAGGTAILVILVFVRLWGTIKTVDRHERHFRALVEHSSDIISIYDADGVMQYVSPSMLPVLGTEPSQWIGRDALELVHPADARGLRSQFARLSRTRDGRQLLDLRVRHSDGTWRQLEVVATNRLDDPAVHGIVANARDITARAEAEGELRRSKTLSSAVINSGYDGIFAFDRKCAITVWNPAMERTTGIRRQHILGRNVIEVFPFLRENGEDKLIFGALNGEPGNAPAQPNRMPETGIEGFFEANYSPLREPGGDVIGGLCIVRDVTERTVTERALSGRNRVLALVAEGGTLESALTEICHVIETSLPGGYCSVMLIDRTSGNLAPFAGPSMPKGFLDAVSDAGGVTPGPLAGSCGAAAFHRAPVVSPDIVTDPLWADFAGLATSHGLYAGWSVPILDGVDGEVFGTFAMYHGVSRAPTPAELAQVVEASHLAGIAIRADRAQEAVRFQADLLDQVAAAVVATDSRGTVTHWNRHATALYGWERTEAVGRGIAELIVNPGDADAIRANEARVQLGDRWEGEVAAKRKDGPPLSVQLSLSPLTDDRGKSIGIVGVAVDLSERKAFEARLAHQAFHDALTGLPNRTLFADRLDHALSVAGRRGETTAVLMLDLDRFKVINDGLGHAFGDRVLVAAARRIGRCLREVDTLARLGGDEFAILLEGVSPVETRAIADRIIASFREPLVIGGREVYSATSVGIAMSASVHANGDEILRAADIALYRAKRAGRGTMVIFDPRDADSETDWIALEADLRHALARDELTLHFQPVVNLSDRRVVGVEALARWQHPIRGFVPPAKFIPLAEETGVITRITDWVIRSACLQLAAWQRELADGAPATISVNVTSRDLRDEGLLTRIDLALAEAGLPPRCLRLEITEQVLVEELRAATAVLRELRARGIGLAIDDFGAGASSLASLRAVDAEVLKLDRSFVRGLGTDLDGPVVIGAITAMAHALDLLVVAEGVESVDQMEAVALAGCDRAQGYLFAAPMTGYDFSVWLTVNVARESSLVPS